MGLPRDLEPRTPDAAGQAIENLATEATLAAVAPPPPQQAEVILLRVVACLDNEAVARIVGRSPGAVRAAAHRAVASPPDHRDDWCNAVSRSGGWDDDMRNLPGTGAAHGDTAGRPCWPGACCPRMRRRPVARPSPRSPRCPRRANWPVNRARGRCTTRGSPPRAGRGSGRPRLPPPSPPAQRQAGGGCRRGRRRPDRRRLRGRAARPGAEFRAPDAAGTSTTPGAGPSPGPGRRPGPGLAPARTAARGQRGSHPSGQPSAASPHAPAGAAGGMPASPRHPSHPSHPSHPPNPSHPSHPPNPGHPACGPPGHAPQGA